MSRPRTPVSKGTQLLPTSPPRPNLSPFYDVKSSKEDTFGNEKEGHLFRWKGHYYHRWQIEWIALQHNFLITFAFDDRLDVKRCVALAAIQSIEPSPTRKDPTRFMVNYLCGRNTQATLIFKGATEKESEEWVTALRKAVKNVISEAGDEHALARYLPLNDAMFMLNAEKFRYAMRNLNRLMLDRNRFFKSLSFQRILIFTKGLDVRDVQWQAKKTIEEGRIIMRQNLAISLLDSFWRKHKIVLLSKAWRLLDVPLTDKGEEEALIERIEELSDTLGLERARFELAGATRSLIDVLENRFMANKRFAVNQLLSGRVQYAYKTARFGLALTLAVNAPMQRTIAGAFSFLKQAWEKRKQEVHAIRRLLARLNESIMREAFNRISLIGMSTSVARRHSVTSARESSASIFFLLHALHSVVRKTLQSSFYDLKLKCLDAPILTTARLLSQTTSLATEILPGKDHAAVGGGLATAASTAEMMQSHRILMNNLIMPLHIIGIRNLYSGFNAIRCTGVNSTNNKTLIMKQQFNMHLVTIFVNLMSKVTFLNVFNTLKSQTNKKFSAKKNIEGMVRTITNCYLPNLHASIAALRMSPPQNGGWLVTAESVAVSVAVYALVSGLKSCLKRHKLTCLKTLVLNSLYKSMESNEHAKIRPVSPFLAGKGIDISGLDVFLTTDSKEEEVSLNLRPLFQPPSETATYVHFPTMAANPQHDSSRSLSPSSYPENRISNSSTRVIAVSANPSPPRPSSAVSRLRPERTFQKEEPVSSPLRSQPYYKAPTSPYMSKLPSLNAQASRDSPPSLHGSSQQRYGHHSARTLESAIDPTQHQSIPSVTVVDAPPAAFANIQETSNYYANPLPATQSSPFPTKTVSASLSANSKIEFKDTPSANSSESSIAIIPPRGFAAFDPLRQTSSHHSSSIHAYPPIPVHNIVEKPLTTLQKTMNAAVQLEISDHSSSRPVPTSIPSEHSGPPSPNVCELNDETPSQVQHASQIFAHPLSPLCISPLLQKKHAANGATFATPASSVKSMPSSSSSPNVFMSGIPPRSISRSPRTKNKSNVSTSQQYRSSALPLSPQFFADHHHQINNSTTMLKPNIMNGMSNSNNSMVTLHGRFASNSIDQVKLKGDNIIVETNDVKAFERISSSSARLADDLKLSQNPSQNQFYYKVAQSALYQSTDHHLTSTRKDSDAPTHTFVSLNNNISRQISFQDHQDEMNKSDSQLSISSPGLEIYKRRDINNSSQSSVDERSRVRRFISSSSQSPTYPLHPHSLQRQPLSPAASSASSSSPGVRVQPHRVSPYHTAVLSESAPIPANPYQPHHLTSFSGTRRRNSADPLDFLRTSEPTRMFQPSSDSNHRFSSNHAGLDERRKSYSPSRFTQAVLASKATSQRSHPYGVRTGESGHSQQLSFELRTPVTANANLGGASQRVESWMQNTNEFGVEVVKDSITLDVASKKRPASIGLPVIELDVKRDTSFKAIHQAPAIMRISSNPQKLKMPSSGVSHEDHSNDEDHDYTSSSDAEDGPNVIRHLHHTQVSANNKTNDSLSPMSKFWGMEHESKFKGPKRWNQNSSNEDDFFSQNKKLRVQVKIRNSNGI